MNASMRQAAEAYEFMSRYDAAATMYRSIVEHSPDDLDAAYQLVNALLMHGAHDEAVAEQRHIAERSMELDDQRAQIEALSQLVSLEPENASAAEQLAEASA